MEGVVDALRRVGVWLIAVALGAIGLLVILRAVLPPLAHTATAFIATPGGLVLVVLSWRLSHVRKNS